MTPAHSGAFSPTTFELPLAPSRSGSTYVKHRVPPANLFPPLDQLLVEGSTLYLGPWRLTFKHLHSTTCMLMLLVALKVRSGKFSVLCKAPSFHLLCSHYQNKYNPLPCPHITGLRDKSAPCRPFFLFISPLYSLHMLTLCSCRPAGTHDHSDVFVSNQGRCSELQV